MLLRMKVVAGKYESGGGKVVAGDAVAAVTIPKQYRQCVVVHRWPPTTDTAAGNVTNHRVTWAADAVRRAQVQVRYHRHCREPLLLLLLRLLHLHITRHPQAGITPLERRSDVAPKRGRPPKKHAPAPDGAGSVASDAGESNKRHAAAADAHALATDAVLADEHVDASAQDSTTPPGAVPEILAGSNDCGRSADDA
jgi:hypothetical protein